MDFDNRDQIRYDDVQVDCKVEGSLPSFEFKENDCIVFKDSSFKDTSTVFPNATCVTRREIF